MVQKGKVEETILESMPQLVIQILNTWLLGQISRIPALTIFSISLSLLSIGNTVWYYAYWNLFKCKPIRDVPNGLSLYNYKLDGVVDGSLSFGRSPNALDISKVSSGADSKDRQPLKEATTDNAIENDLSNAGSRQRIIKSGASLAANDFDGADHRNKMPDSKYYNQICAENDKQRKQLQAMRHEISRLKQELNRSSGKRLVIPSAFELVASPRFSVFDLRPAVCGPRIIRAAILIQSVTRGHFGRRLVHAHCIPGFHIERYPDSSSDESHVSLLTGPEAECDVSSVDSCCPPYISLTNSESEHNSGRVANYAAYAAYSARHRSLRGQDTAATELSPHVGSIFQPGDTFGDYYSDE